ncbi:MAG TPA: hypothetical protein VGK22_07165 [Candidatus Angelobacter sp.]|jgi:uncharacterized membrane-anchored protein
MKPFYKGLAIALIHVLIVLSLGGKLLYDRATRPRVWVRTASADPDLPIRGRYVALNLEVRSQDPSQPPDLSHPGLYSGGSYVDLAVENGQLIAHKTDRRTGMMINAWGWSRNGDKSLFLLSPPVDFFLPEHAEMPNLGLNNQRLGNQRSGNELWVEVTVPKKGPPRPIQLAIKRGNEWMPLTYR